MENASISACQNGVPRAASDALGVRLDSGRPGTWLCHGQALHSRGRNSSSARTCHITVAVGSAAMPAKSAGSTYPFPGPNSPNSLAGPSSMDRFVKGIPVILMPLYPGASPSSRTFGARSCISRHGVVKEVVAVRAGGHGRQPVDEGLDGRSSHPPDRSDTAATRPAAAWSDRLVTSRFLPAGVRLSSPECEEESCALPAGVDRFAE